jgi:ArsR family transcriptional regulator
MNRLIDNEAHIIQAAETIKAIAHPLRLKALCVLADGELCVQDIVDQIGTSQSNISQHLSILRNKKILYAHKNANRIFYRIDDARIIKLIVMMRDIFCAE